MRNPFFSLLMSLPSKLFLISVILAFHMSPAIPESENQVDEIISKLYLGRTEEARELVRKLTDINAVSSSGSPLLVAMAQVPGVVDTALFDRVFEKDPNCNLRDKKGMTALYFAASLGNSNLVERLLKGGADINLSSDYGSALVGAAWNNRPEVAHRLLLVPGIKVDLADHEGRTALIFAVIHGDLELVRDLIHKGANPNIYEIDSGNSPLLWSAKGSKELVAFLLDSHADSRLPNPFNCQTIVHAAVAANNIDVVRLLLDRNVIASSADSQRRTPLGIAISMQNTEISELLKKTLTSKGMNVSDTGDPPPNCHDDHLITYAVLTSKPPKGAKDGPQQFVPLARTTVHNWESKHNVFLNPDTPLFVAGQISLFQKIDCYPNNNPKTVADCKALLSDQKKLSDLVAKQLTNDFIDKPEITTWLAASLSDSIGVNFEGAGYIVHAPNEIVCSQLPNNFIDDSALFVGPEGFIQLRPGVTLCLTEDAYQIFIPSKSVLLKSWFYSRHTRPTPIIEVIPARSITTVMPDKIVPPSNSVSLLEQPITSPLTMPLPRRDDIRIAAPRNFSTVASVQVSIKDDSGLCVNACATAVKTLLVKAIAVWKFGCTRCSLDNLLTIQFSDRAYFNIQAVDILAARSPSVSRASSRSGEERPTLPISTVSAGYEELDGRNPKISRLCTTSTSYAQLCQNSSGSSAMKIVLEISNKSDACLTPETIACASPDGVIQLRAADHVFRAKQPLSSNSSLFGSGSQRFDLLAVLIHELGHFFGLPHLDESTPKITGKSDVMVPTYNPNGVWVTTADFTLLNKAVDPEWPFRLGGCAGLKY